MEVQDPVDVQNCPLESQVDSNWNDFTLLGQGRPCDVPSLLRGKGKSPCCFLQLQQTDHAQLIDPKGDEFPENHKKNADFISTKIEKLVRISQEHTCFSF